ncbi:MAG TPA: hypothetical protein VFH43_00300 [Candidatus Kapabacteria bacterium]|nr:hypothetical protein [Candidatus Kapabacteria bacterium]
MKHWLPIVLFVITIGIASEARSQYTFTHAKQPYQKLEGGLVLPMRWDDTVNPYSYVDLEGLTFEIYGERFPIDNIYPIGISKWGNVEINNGKSAVIIDPFHTSILDSMVPSTSVSVHVDGMLGDRILKIQWTDMGFEGRPVDITTSFQLWMYERSNNIEFRYGPHSMECIKDDPTLQGGYVGMFIAPADFSKISKIFWVYGDPENPKISKLNIRAMHCPFDADVVATIVAPTASVSFEEVPEQARGIYVAHGSSIGLTDARNARLFTIMGQQVLSMDQVEGSISLQGVASGRYFLEYEADGNTHRRAVIIE